MSRVELNLKELEHLKPQSFYNNNYYKLCEETVLFEHCSDEYEEAEYWLLNKEGQKVFFGNSQNPFDEVVTIELFVRYT